MKRQIIKIDEKKCDGCGLCAAACHEGAIGIANGKARLLRDDYCDGLGDCLPVCPAGAISFEEREAAAYCAEAVKRSTAAAPLPAPEAYSESRLMQWPIQIKLVSAAAPFFDGAKLLIAADCTAFAYGSFHERFMKNHITLIGCPKLDGCDYSEKLTAILKENHIESITVVRMTVPCCGGIAAAVMQALKNTGKRIPCQIITVSTDGKLQEASR